MKEKLIELAQYMRDNNESSFVACEQAKSVSEAAEFAYDKWMEKKPEGFDREQTGKVLLDFKVQWVLKLAETL
jgi:hypothetical protein